MKIKVITIMVVLFATVYFGLVYGKPKPFGQRDTSFLSPVINLLLDDTLPSTFAPVTEAEEVLLPEGYKQLAAKNQILIHLKDDVTQEEYDFILATIRSKGLSILGYSETLGIWQVGLTDAQSEVALMTEFGQLMGVRYVGLNSFVRPLKVDNNYEGYQEYLNRITNVDFITQSLAFNTNIDFSFSGDYWIEKIDLSSAWEIEDELNESLEKVTIGIVDTGVSKEQEVIDESRLIRYNASGDKVTDDDSLKVSTHGAIVTAFAAGFFDKNGSKLSRGVSRHSSVASIDVYTKECLIFNFFCELSVTGFLDGLVTSINKGADIINVSSGGEAPCNASRGYRLISQIDFRESMGNFIELANKEDRLVVFSAGNECEKRDDKYVLRSDDPINLVWSSNTLIVGATNDNDNDSLFSRMGEVVSLTAPGEEIGYGNGELNNGTSFSAPIMAGSAAIVKGINGTLSAPEVRNILIATAEPSVVFADAKSEKYDGYDGESAITPNLLLNVGRAAESAKLTRGIPLEEQELTSISEGDIANKKIKYKVPESTVTALDVVFLVDVSGSFGDDIMSLQSSASDVIGNLDSKGIDVQYGVASYSDFPLQGFGSGSAGDQAYFLNQPVTDSRTDILNAIDNLDKPLRIGGDFPESQLEALYQVATGAGNDINNDGDFEDEGELTPQSMGWRTGALKVVVFTTDASFHDSDMESNYPGTGGIETIQALQDQDIVVMGLRSGSSSQALADIKKITNATGGQVFNLSSNSSEVATAIESALDSALSKVDITLEQISGSEWVKGVTPLIIEDVTPGQEVTFNIELKGVKASPRKDLNYAVYLWMRGDGSALLKRVKIPITVVNPK